VKLHRKLLEEINLVALESLPPDRMRQEVQTFVSDYVREERLALNAAEVEGLIDDLVDEMVGLGPLEPLLKDPTVSDILINGHENCFVERAGKLVQENIPFKDEAHLLRVVNKIVAAVGRRIDESQPMCDARMLDGSRFNAAIRPVGVDGPLVSIRKFSKNKLGLHKLVEFGALTQPMAEVLAAAVFARITTIISGGTGTGKTTMLNALSAFISEDERLITIEDAAELQLQQPHVARMETQTGKCRGGRRNQAARPRQERASHASRSCDPRRVPRRRGIRHAAGHEHRPRRLDGDNSRQHASRCHCASGADARHDRHADDRRFDPKPDIERHRAHRPADAGFPTASAR
jgi:pilus assembly protein CpaF